MLSLNFCGASSEITEIAQEYTDEKAASRLITKAVAYRALFTPEEIFDLAVCCNQEATIFRVLLLFIYQVSLTYSLFGSSSQFFEKGTTSYEQIGSYPVNDSINIFFNKLTGMSWSINICIIPLGVIL